MLRILINILWSIKIKTKNFTVFYYNHMFSVNIMTWLNCCKSFADFNVLIQNLQYLSYFIFNFYELFPAFICANNDGSLVKLLCNLFSSFIFSSSFLGVELVVYQLILLYQSILNFRTLSHICMFYEINFHDHLEDPIYIF